MPVLKRSFGLAIGAAAWLVIFSGCKTPAPTPEPAIPASAPVAQDTNPIPPAVSFPDIRPIPPKESADTIAPNLLAWDADSKTYRVKPGELNVDFAFNLTNVSSEIITIYDTSTSCDCTVAQMPAKPWPVPPGGHGQIQATVDLRNKYGTVTNYVVVFTSKGNKLLLLNSILPESSAPSAAK